MTSEQDVRVNTQLPPQRFDAYLRFLRRVMVLGRAASQSGNSERAEALLDAAHNVPSFLLGEEHTSFEDDFIPLAVEPLLRRYPDLQPLLEDLPPR